VCAEFSQSNFGPTWGSQVFFWIKKRTDAYHHGRDFSSTGTGPESLGFDPPQEGCRRAQGLHGLPRHHTGGDAPAPRIFRPRPRESTKFPGTLRKTTPRGGGTKSQHDSEVQQEP
jgi:hypothetical protein